MFFIYCNNDYLSLPASPVQNTNKMFKIIDRSVIIRLTRFNFNLNFLLKLSLSIKGIFAAMNISSFSYFYPSNTNSYCLLLCCVKTMFLLWFKLFLILILELFLKSLTSDRYVQKRSQSMY